ncbi:MULTISPECIES: hypothetical protein [unclassified Isoptericola]|uniref:hypothetical protein n=1 Tax=unclassified Isoptericola TaxID=2623355 RepID=UPI0036540F23
MTSLLFLMLGALAGLVLLCVALLVFATWTPRLRRHVALPCVRCGRCCCTECRAARRQGPWRAPAGGGYHACRAVDASVLRPCPRCGQTPCRGAGFSADGLSYSFSCAGTVGDKSQAELLADDTDG